MFAIKAKVRKAGEKTEALRKTGEIPAVFYGMGKPTTPISISTIEFKKIWRNAGESSTVTLTTPTGTIDTLIHEVQTDPVTDEPIHADFLAIDINKAIKVKIQLEFVGISNAVKTGIGTLVKVLHEVEVEALPKNLPHNISVDISKLENLDSQVLVSDLVLPNNVTLITKMGDVVASIAEQKEEVEEVAAPVDLSTIEVEKRGKKEEEGAVAEEGTAQPEKTEKTEKKK